MGGRRGLQGVRVVERERVVGREQLGRDGGDGQEGDQDERDEQPGRRATATRRGGARRRRGLADGGHATRQPGIDDRVRHVDEQVGEHVERGHQRHQADDDRQVVRVDRGDEHRPDAGAGEDRLHDDGSREGRAERPPGQGHRGEHRVTQHVPQAHRDIPHAAHPGGQHERLIQRALELGAGRLAEEAGERDGEREGGQHETGDARCLR